jgi:hypothetical protein
VTAGRETKSKVTVSGTLSEKSSWLPLGLPKISIEIQSSGKFPTGGSRPLVAHICTLALVICVRLRLGIMHQKCRYYWSEGLRSEMVG